jgi:hypothetical protein
MKTKALKCAVVFSMLVGGLTACGGGDDDQAGQKSEFQVSPAEVEIEWDGATCGSTKAGDFVIIGGTAPYTLYSSFTELITMSTPVVNDRNTQFTAYISGCFDPGTITILDAQGRTITVEIASTAASAP